MDLSTTYMGLKLCNPLVIAASPLSKHIDRIRRMEDLGASAVVLYSLFEEDISGENKDLNYHLNFSADSSEKALENLTDPTIQQNNGLAPYLKHLAAAKASVDIPIIGSLNGTSTGGWIDHACQIEEAGADALELNIYYIPTDLEVAAATIEQKYVDILKSVKSKVTIPVAIKLSPFFTNLAHMARQLEGAGANALVLFNRFYQPDIVLETREVAPHLLLSGPQDMRLPLCWIGLLYGKVFTDFAATSGVHRVEDVVKLIMAGADVTMLCAALLRYGLQHIQFLEQGLKSWMEEHEYGSLTQIRGSMSQLNYDNPAAFERAQYVQAIHTHSRIHP